MFISPIAMMHIRQKTDKSVYEIYETLNSFSHWKKLNTYKLYFYYYLLEPNKPNANAFSYKKIKINSAWAIKLLNNLNDEELLNAFAITIGHELGHKEKHINRLYHLPNLKFLSWVQEVYCDFYGTAILAKNEKNKLISSIMYKMKNKNQDYSDTSHPSWNQRLEYARYGQFDDKLIAKIYENSGCKSEKILSIVLDFYEERFIVLN